MTESDAKVSGTGSTGGRLLTLAQVVWVACAAPAFLILLASIPFGYLPHLDNAFPFPIDAPGWYVQIVSYVYAVLSLLTAFVSLALAVLLFSQRRREPMALFASFFLLALGVVLEGPLGALAGASVFVPGLAPLTVSGETVMLFQSSLFALLPLLFYLFPNGRMVPGWTRFTTVATLALAPAAIHVFNFEWPAALSPFGRAVMLAYSSLLGAGLFAQTYRYRRVSTTLERQQSKWVILGLFLTLAIMGVLQIWAGQLSTIPEGVAHPWWQTLTGFAWRVSSALLPLSFAFAVLRYRLWDVDVIINRTLVYGTLSAGVIIMYVLTVGLLGAELKTNADLLAAVTTFSMVALLYRPVVVPVQRLVDRAFPGNEGRQARANPAENAPAHVSPRRWLIVAQAAWLICTAAAVLFLIAAIPLGYVPYVARATWESSGGTPIALFTILYFMSATIAFLVPAICITLGVLLFWKRRDEPIALYVSFFLLGYAIFVGGPAELVSSQRFLPVEWYQVMGAVMVGAPMLLLLYLLPNGKFVPHWTRWAGLGVVLLTPFLVGLSNEAALKELDPKAWLVVALLLALALLGVYAQIYRYRRAANPLERQQTKWIMYSLVLNIFFQLVLGIPYIFAERLFGGMEQPWWTPIGDMTWWLTVSIPPAGIAIAVLRYRLWDVDILINRTLLYGTLTAGIIALYVLVVGTLSTVSQTTGNLIISLIATGLVALMVQPLRERLQRGVNRLLYGERDEPYAMMARLGQDLETTTAPDAILHSLVRTIAQAMKLPYITIETSGGEGTATTASFGEARGDVQIVPLTYQGQSVGRLYVAPRSPNEPLSAADLNLLKIIAQQAGMAVHAVQLTEDLQRSRERLVIAREEERRRIRRDLHDGLGPVLASLAMRADEAREGIRRDPEGTEATLAEIAQKSQVALQDIRRLVYDLRPPALDELGLVGALKQTAANSSNGLHIEIDTPEALPPLSAAVEAAAYRIAQETLNNVARHARAQHCTVRIRAQDELQIEIDDDGIGLPPDVQPGVGLVSMRERAAELGGTCLIDPKPGGGTRVMARLPLMASKRR